MATLVEVNRAGVVLRSSVTARTAACSGVRRPNAVAARLGSHFRAGRPTSPWSGNRLPGAGTDPAADALLQTVRFDLAKPLSPGQSLEVALTAQRHPDDWLEQDEGFSELPLPELRLAGADEVEGTLLIQAPPDIELLVSDLSDDLQPVAADRSRECFRSRRRAPPCNTVTRTTPRISGRLQVRTKPAKVSAETLAFVRLDRGKLDVHYQLDLHIRQGTMRQIRFTLPAAVGEKIQIVPVDSAARVIEQQHSPLPDAGDDRRRVVPCGRLSWTGL